MGKNNEKFITLHIRQLGWRGENISNSTEILELPMLKITFKLLSISLN